MAGSHEKLPKLFWIQVILVLIVGTLYLLAPSAKKHEAAGNTSDDENSARTDSAANNLKPIGKVATNASTAPAGDTQKSDSGVAPVAANNAANNAANKVAENKEATASTKKARSGEQIYNNICSTCHNAGIANAPKLNDKAAWQPRVANGLGELFKIAAAGKGAMPPRGGAPNISDEELKATILYMTHKAGFDLSAKRQSTDESPQSKQAMKEQDQKTQNQTEPQQTVASKNEPPTETKAEPNTEPKTEPKKEPKAELKTEPNTEIAKKQNETKITAPPAPVESTAQNTAIMAKAAEVSAEAPDAPAMTSTPHAPPAPPAEPVMPPAMSANNNLATKPNSEDHLKKGKTVYSQSCFACHDNGVAGAPKITDKENWKPRLATGKQALYHAALNGKGVMPAKGGNTHLSDEDVKAAVDYMAATAAGQ